MGFDGGAVSDVHASSAERKVLGQIRIMGYCFMMGEATGLASYLAVRDGVAFDGVNVLGLQCELFKNGVETI